MTGEHRGAEVAARIDWSQWGPIHQTVYCRCGASYRSHHKLHNFHGELKSVAQLPCPGCGSHLDSRRVESDRDDMRLTGVHQINRSQAESS